MKNCLYVASHLLKTIKKQSPKKGLSGCGVIGIFLAFFLFSPVFFMFNLFSPILYFFGDSGLSIFMLLCLASFFPSLGIYVGINMFLFAARKKTYAKLLKIDVNAQALYELGLQSFQANHVHQIELAQAQYQESVDSINIGLDSQIEQLHLSIKIFTNKVTELSGQWEPFSLSMTIPKITRLGCFIRDFHKYKFFMPALFPFPGQQSLLFKQNGTANSTVVQAIQALSLRLLATIPPSKLRFTFFDPVALGQNIAPFMHLKGYDEKLVNSRAWSDRQHIEKRLAEITETMENIIQTYLLNTYPTIEEYNQHVGELPEPYRFVIVMDFPVNFTEDAVRHLIRIVQNGPRCGVYAIISYDISQKLPYNVNINDLEQFCIVFDRAEQAFKWRDPDYQDYFLQFDQPPDAEIFNNIVKTVGKEAVKINKVEVPFEKILQKADLSYNVWWKSLSIQGIQAPLGPVGANKVQYLEFGKGTAQHALVAGKTGSGKSTLLHVLISTLVLKYSPNDVQLYLIDFKKGVEFKTYATHQLPHARVIAIESEREFGLSVLEGLDVELKRRGDICRKVGVDGLKAYREKSGESMPRILLLVDEFQEFFTEDDAIASKCSQILDRLVRQGRAFGIHLFLGSQTLAGAYSLSRSTIDQMAIRIALQCSEADSRLILSDDNPAARLLSRPGEAIYNAANGMVEGNNRFQVAWLPDDKQEYYLDQVKVLARAQGLFPPKQQIVFEGNAPAHPDANLALNALFDSAQSERHPERSRRVAAWLGEPIAIKEATAAHFRRQSGSNLLVVGQQDEAAMGMFAAMMLTLSAQYPRNSVKFYALDFGDVDAAHADVLNNVVALLPGGKYGKRRQLGEFINTIAQEIEHRVAHEHEGLEKQPTIFFLIYGLQRARDLEKDDGFGFQMSAAPAFGLDEPEQSPPPSNPGKQLPKILRDGPDVGIHSIIWCDTNANLQRRLDRQLLREFDMRVVFQMSNDDSLNLIDSAAASKIGQHRALFYSEEEGRLEKFRPFALPNEDWLQQIGQRLGKA